MTTIVSLRGTHGSGKSSVVAKILQMYAATPVADPTRPKKPLGYLMKLPTGRKLYVVGSYTTACGGCDAIQPYSLIWPRIDLAAQEGYDVLYEGAMISSSYGNIGRSSEKYGSDVVYAFLDTPEDECVRRVNLRRSAKGKPPLGDETNVRTKWRSVLKMRLEFAERYGVRVAVVDHTRAVKRTLELFGVVIRKEP